MHQAPDGVSRILFGERLSVFYKSGATYVLAAHATGINRDRDVIVLTLKDHIKKSQNVCKYIKERGPHSKEVQDALFNFAKRCDQHRLRPGDSGTLFLDAIPSMWDEVTVINGRNVAFLTGVNNDGVLINGFSHGITDSYYNEVVESKEETKEEKPQPKIEDAKPKKTPAKASRRQIKIQSAAAASVAAARQVNKLDPTLAFCMILPDTLAATFNVSKMRAKVSEASMVGDSETCSEVLRTVSDIMAKGFTIHKPMLEDIAKTASDCVKGRLRVKRSADETACSNTVASIECSRDSNDTGFTGARAGCRLFSSDLVYDGDKLLHDSTKSSKNLCSASCHPDDRLVAGSRKGRNFTENICTFIKLKKLKITKGELNLSGIDSKYINFTHDGNHRAHLSHTPTFCCKYMVLADSCSSFMMYDKHLCCCNVVSSPSFGSPYFKAVVVISTQIALYVVGLEKLSLIVGFFSLLWAASAECVVAGEVIKAGSDWVGIVDMGVGDCIMWGNATLTLVKLYKRQIYTHAYSVLYEPDIQLSMATGCP